jgi:hypothetical protein
LEGKLVIEKGNNAVDGRVQNTIVVPRMQNTTEVLFGIAL